MQKILKNIISTKPLDIDPITKIRSAFVGKVIDIDQLLGGSYKVMKSEKPDWCILTRQIGNRYKKLTILVGPGRRLAMVTLAHYLEISDEGLLGWYDFVQMSCNAANRITKELSSAVSCRSFTGEGEKYDEELKWLRINDLDDNEKAKVDGIIDGLVAESYSIGHVGITSVLISALLREMENITDGGIISDIPFFCGRLRMRQEFYYACERAFRLNLSWADTAITNIGSVLCDTFHLYELANQCFQKALLLNPSQIQAKANMVVVVERLMWMYANTGNYDLAIETGLECIKTCKPVTHAPFCAMLALSFELSGDNMKATKYYRMALDYDPLCQTSSDGIRRLGGKSDKSYSALDSLRSFKRDLCPSDLHEDFIHEKFCSLVDRKW